MNIFKNLLIKGGRLVVKEVLNELGVGPLIKETIKAKLMQSYTISKWDNGDLHKSFTDYLITNHLSKIQNTSFGRNHSLHYEFGEHTSRSTSHLTIDSLRIVVKIKGATCLITKSKNRETDPDSSTLSDVYIITTAKSNKKTLDSFVFDLAVSTDLKNNQTDTISALMYKKNWQHLKRYSPLDLDKVVLKKEVKDTLIKDIDTFLSKKEWYTTRCIPFSRKYLLYGPPRTGKSSLVAAIAKKYSRNLFYLNLGALKNDDCLMDAFMAVPPGAILVIEDIDAIWNGRVPVNKECKLNFSTLLNLLSGVLEREDLIVFITTNHIETLDPALIGSKRIDLKLFIDLPEKEEVEEYLSDLYEEKVSLKAYKKGRDMGTILNLFEEHWDRKEDLVNLLNSEA